MNRSKKLSHLYVKYVIKNPALFYTFLLAGICLFLYLSIQVSLDVRSLFDISLNGNRVTVSGTVIPESDTMYLCRERDDKIYVSTITSVSSENGRTIMTLSNTLPLSGDLQAELVTGRQTLLERIFVRAGKSDE